LVTRLRTFTFRQDSIIYQALFKPRWKPWSPRRVVLTALGFGAAMLLLIIVTPKVGHEIRVRMFGSPTDLKEDAPEVSPGDAPGSGERADANLSRKGRSPIAGGLLTIPQSFASADGAYDLVIHFHGNTDLVEESYQKVGINAAVVIMNLGTGSGVYEDRYSAPAILPDVLDRTRGALEKRGLRRATLRRLALSAWSAGYGAVSRILDQPQMREKVDAIILLDGLHCGYLQGSHELAMERLASFERFAKQAIEGKKLFSITHSNITPLGEYAGTHETTDALLKRVGVPRTKGGDPPPMPPLSSIDGVVQKKSLRPLQPESEAHLRGLYVRGYGGDQPDHHSMHLVQMSVTALPDLVQYWSSTEPP